MRTHRLLFCLVWTAFAAGSAHAVELNVRTVGADSRIDILWENTYAGYNVYRSQSPQGPFEKINKSPCEVGVYSDFLGENDKQYYYRVTALNKASVESPPSQTVSAISRAMTDDELLESVQQATLRYFCDYGHPVSARAPERKGGSDTCTTGGTGFGLMAIMVGCQRGFLQRDEAAERILRIVTFLEEKAQRYHGAWSHWVNGRTGKTIPFSEYDNGGDLVETSYLIQGMLTVRQYFNADNDTEKQLRERISRLWRQVEWDWYLKDPSGRKLYWHWSPDYGWKMNHTIGGHFNECMITYLLAIASETHPIPPQCYYAGWVGQPDSGYANGKSFYGYRQWVGWDRGGPLFFTHYSFLGFDPRGKRDKYCSYFANNRNISLINRAYCAENPGKHKGYSEVCWGLTASDTPGGYKAHQPNDDNGTISPTAAISAIVYTPKESIAALRHFYHVYGERLWGEFGFKDAFNPDKDWFAESYLAIDQGPIVIMIENYRSGLCWKMFMSNPEIARMLAGIGWTSE